MVNARASCARSREFDSQDCRILHKVASGSPTPQVAVLLWCYVAKMDTANSLHAST